MVCGAENIIAVVLQAGVDSTHWFVFQSGNCRYFITEGAYIDLGSWPKQPVFISGYFFPFAPLIFNQNSAVLGLRYLFCVYSCTVCLVLVKLTI